MNEILLTAADYRWLASLSAPERRLALDLIRLLDVRLVDSPDPSHAYFLAALDDGDVRSVTDRGPR